MTDLPFKWDHQKTRPVARPSKHQKLVILLIFFVSLVDVAAQIENVEEAFFVQTCFCILSEQRSRVSCHAPLF